jgi:Ring finger domain
MDNRAPVLGAVDVSEDTRRFVLMYDMIMEYNHTVRTNNRAFHENMTVMLQILRGTQQRRTPYNQYFTQTGAAHSNRYAYYSRPMSDTIYTNIINDTVNHILPNLYPVNLTNEQIAAATETLEYSPGEYTHTVCPISLEEFVEGEQVCRITHCGHMFREAAIRNWFRRNVRCPVCRYDIRRGNPTVPANDEPIAPAPEPEQNITNSMEQIVQNLSNGLNNIIQNLDRNPSANHTYSFELPVYIYNDLSGN